VHSPEQVLQQAAGLGLRTIAFSDHDNANGARQGLALAAGLGIELIPGVEFTTSWPGLRLRPDSNDIDLLGYFIDLDHAGFKALEAEAKADVSLRLADCARRLSSDGDEIRLDAILAVNPRFPSLASLMEVIKARGFAGDFEQDYRKVTAAWRQGRYSRIEIERAIQVIHAAGGVAVLAHPGRIKLEAGLLQAADIVRLVDLGLDGLEIYHPAHDLATRAYFLDLAQRFGLLTSGGTDYHGRRATPLGMPDVTPEMVEALHARHLRHL
jgi:predicted metal-dependent phosphoesterase TrpH